MAGAPVCPICEQAVAGEPVVMNKLDSAPESVHPACVERAVAAGYVNSNSL